MSSHFVSGGTILPGSEEGTKDAPGPSSIAAAAPREQLSSKNIEWEAVEKELEADRKRREEQRLKTATGEEKSLYDILQANKAAKQEAFEEQNKIRNQFRALDDDEIGFLDEVMAAKRQEEDKVKRETEEGLKAFRERQRRTSSGAAGGGDEQPDEKTGGNGETEDWGVGRKRKRVKEREIMVKRKASSSEADGHGEKAGVAEEEGEQKTKSNDEADTREKKDGEGSRKVTAAAEPAKKSSGLALVDYGSDDSD